MASAFYGVDLTTLYTLQASYLAAVASLATATSYEMSVVARDGVQSQRSVNRADLPSIKATLAEINDEIRRQEGTQPSRVGYADFTYFSR